MKKLTLLIPFLLLTSTSNTMWEKFFSCGKPNPLSPCEVASKEEIARSSSISQKDKDYWGYKDTKAFHLAVFCHELTRKEVDKNYTEIMKSPGDIYSKSFHIFFGHCEWRDCPSELNAQEIVNRKISRGCNAEGCVRLHEIFKEAERKLEEQKRNQANTDYKKLVDDLKK